MAARSSIWLVLAGAVASMGAAYRTPNFVVEAPTPEIAKEAGQYAEYYRKQKAIQWLGQEMPQWPDPCPLRITITMNGSGGATLVRLRSRPYSRPGYAHRRLAGSPHGQCVAA